MTVPSPRRVACLALGVLGVGIGNLASLVDATASASTAAQCPDYNQYAQQPHAPYSEGPLKLPFMRPSEECRTFNSPAVEKVIEDMKARLKDPDLARLFENTFPSTLDTTVKYFDPALNLAFIITGDITAQWLRDTGNQFAHLYKLLPYDQNLKSLVKAVINTEARYIYQFPYCGAFQPPPESGLPPSHNDYADNVRVNPPVDNQTVFECKYELDSLAGKKAMQTILELLRDQSQGSWSDDWTFVSYYNWTGTAGSLSPPVPNGGNGEPRRANGLVASSHRPSDDLCVFNFITSDNAMVAVELARVADVLEAIGGDDGGKMAVHARRFSGIIEKAVWDNTRVGGGIFAYETNGYGGAYIMDDANVPSLLSLPYLGFLARNDSTFVKTKDAMLSRMNPYYAEGRKFKGVGGPHVNATYPWPMSQVSAIYGTDDDDEIAERLALIMGSTSGLGLIHESVHIYNASDYTRPWFAWANSYFAEMVLDLAQRKPGLILEKNEPYVIGQ
ncbi:DUF1237 domain protein [Cordyceps fumosorosea ARSEF 2679]|uniref:DUF1237 domain protein n=1 Tax=Cordyceps fumosorosea (strain ARSEF 2679) TaxID=1081104 RepID=A0A167ZG76_CORFA|nr:DUF1237 domain protein [Cordyceps fumosorosea ARSEF 2679]OAA67478.1 DUF1237 domain protein [Cordyceps fumosorosea ARSEF 2679]